ncbi:MAG: glycosyltransferase [Epsilonproteobacteria bacterium]|nr:glycosyltransferase [Campylobacterota bacterium]
MDGMKSILFVIDTMSTGGAQKVLALITKSLLMTYDCVGVFVIKKTESHFFVEGVEYYFAIEEEEKITTNLFPILNQLSNVIQQYDRIIGFTDFAANYLTSLCATLNKKPYMLSVRCEISSVIESFDLPSVNKSLIELCYGNAQKIICNSIASKNDLRAHYQINEQKIEVLYNPIDIPFTETLSQEAIVQEESILFENQTILAIGRLSYEKNYPMLLKAFKILQKRYHQPIKLLIIGEGGMRQVLEEMIVSLDLSKSVFLLGNKKNVYPYLLRADIFVHPSISEGFPNSLLEAAVLQKPIVASAIAPIKEFITHEENGLLCDPYNLEEMVIALEKLLCNPDLGDTLAKMARQRVETFDHHNLDERLCMAFNI